MSVCLFVSVCLECVKCENCTCVFICLYPNTNLMFVCIHICTFMSVCVCGHVFLSICVMCIFIIKKWMCVFVCVLYVIVFYHFVWMYAYMNMCLWVYWYLRVCCCTVALFLVCDYACIYMCVCVFMCFYMKICVCVCFCLGGDLLIPVYTCIYSAGKPETSSALPWSCIVPGCWGVGEGGGLGPITARLAPVRPITGRQIQAVRQAPAPSACPQPSPKPQLCSLPINCLISGRI